MCDIITFEPLLNGRPRHTPLVHSAHLCYQLHCSETFPLHHLSLVQHNLNKQTTTNNNTLQSQIQGIHSRSSHAHSLTAPLLTIMNSLATTPVQGGGSGNSCSILHASGSCGTSDLSCDTAQMKAPHSWPGQCRIRPGQKATCIYWPLLDTSIV